MVLLNWLYYFLDDKETMLRQSNQVMKKPMMIERFMVEKKTNQNRKIEREVMEVVI